MATAPSGPCSASDSVVAPSSEVGVLTAHNSVTPASSTFPTHTSRLLSSLSSTVLNEAQVTFSRQASKELTGVVGGQGLGKSDRTAGAAEHPPGNHRSDTVDIVQPPASRGRIATRGIHVGRLVCEPGGVRVQLRRAA